MKAALGHDTRVNKIEAVRVARPAMENPMSRVPKKDLIYERTPSRQPLDESIVPVPERAAGSEYSIRGTAGPYVVHGSNFAEGTTAADIESAMMPIGGQMQSCRILTATPTVIAEMIFAEKHNADNVVSTFNNKKVG